ncbi:MAG: hypothetical protein ABUL68_02175, partial [Pseudomonadota bacterium]
MKPAKRCVLAVVYSLGMGLPGLFLGCSSVAKHDVLVDAISAGPPSFSGVSYRLLARDPLLSREVLRYNLALASVGAALAGKGMYAVSAGNHPD